MENRIYPIMVSTLRMKNGGFEVDYPPQVSCLSNPDAQEIINRTIMENVYELIQKQRPFEEMNGTYELKNNDKGVLSLTLINYAFSGGAHGNTIVKALNFDVETGHIYTLPELFKPGSHYVQRISEIIKAEIKARDLPTIGEFTEINPNQDFYIADRSLVIFFFNYMRSHPICRHPPIFQYLYMH